jgi:hypothetical protein
VTFGVVAPSLVKRPHFGTVGEGAGSDEIVVDSHRDPYRLHWLVVCWWEKASTELSLGLHRLKEQGWGELLFFERSDEGLIFFVPGETRVSGLMMQMIDD